MPPCDPNGAQGQPFLAQNPAGHLAGTWAPPGSEEGEPSRAYGDGTETTAPAHQGLTPNMAGGRARSPSDHVTRRGEPGEGRSSAFFDRKGLGEGERRGARPLAASPLAVVNDDAAALRVVPVQRHGRCRPLAAPGPLCACAEERRTGRAAVRGARWDL